MSEAGLKVFASPSGINLTACEKKWSWQEYCLYV